MDQVGRPQAEWAQGPALVTTRQHEEEKPDSVEAVPPDRSATWLGRPATTWRQTDLSKLVEVPFTTINTLLMVKVNTPQSFCSSPLVKVPV
jgi:hypothetical protein